MSQDDRVTSLAGSQREEPFVFLDQRRSCRCANSSISDESSAKNFENPSQTCMDAGPNVSKGGYVVGIEDVITSEPESVEVINNQTISRINFNIDDDIHHFARGCEKISARNSTNYRCNDKNADNDSEQEIHQQQQTFEQRTRSSARSGCQIPSVHPARSENRDSEDFSNRQDDKTDEDRVGERGIIDSRCVSTLSDKIRSSPARINDERPSTAGSSISFTTSCSSDDPTNNSRVHGRLETDSNESHNRSQLISNVHHQQLPIINAFNANRSNNLRSVRDNNRSNNPDLNSPEIDEIHRINVSPPNVGSYSPGFRNLHPEHILQPLQRGTNPTAKGTFDGIQVTASSEVEKGKCQCHLVQQHQHQQPQILSHIQQRDQTHHHHHHHHHPQQQQQQQQQQQHRHKLTQQRAQQQQQQQQNYRHHHYHHPHQHIGQQQEHQRSQNDQVASRKQVNGSGPEDESDEMIETSLGSHQPPALPPRPPPRPSRRYEQNAITAYDLGPNSSEDAGCCKKYVVLCCLCGGLSAAVGSLFLAVHAVLSAHTASLALFETVPSYIPGTMLILMGLFTILLARRKHRYGFLMKMCGSVGVVCALVCVLVTVTTTVVHMSRLQGLRECIYTKKARSCTCYGSTQGRVSSDPGVLFEETPHCEAVHGALYDCLRALFGVSVAGILACIFSCMLLYQLLSHEKKKMYWEQLQLRCRSLYGQGGSGAVGGPTGGSCGCCNDCGGTSPWWAQTPGNLYTPNPDLAPFSRRWRLPWSRSRGPAPTPDSNYGFHTQSRGAVVMRSSGSSSGEPGDNTPGPYSVLTDESQAGSGAPYSLINSTSSAPYAACTSSVASYSLLENGTVPALWGPPPPYSDPNSPARRSQMNEERRPPPPPATIRSPTSNPPSGTPVNASNNRISNAKRTIDSFEPGNCEEYRQQRVTRPSDNYENTEEVLSSSTDPDMEMGGLHQHHHRHHPHHHSQRQQDEDGTKGRRTRNKGLKGVENGGFQQENTNNSLTKQSESELYFGDVSSCCGPESSFYDLAVEKEQQQSGPLDDSLIEYPTSNRLSKQRQSSKRSRLPLPLPSSLNSESSVVALTENYTASLNNPSVVEDLGRNSSTRGPFLAPDAQYEVIAQQTRYTYYNSNKNGEHVLEIPLSSLASLAYRGGGNNNKNNNTNEQDDDELDRGSAVDYPNERLPVEHCGNNEGKPGTPSANSPSPSSIMMSSSQPSSPMSRVSNMTQRCNAESSGNSRDSLWQNDHQARSVEAVCPVNV